MATTEFTANGAHFKREVFAYHPDGVLVMRLTADHKAAIGFTLSYDGAKLPCERKTRGDDTLIVTGRAFGPHSDGKTGVGLQKSMALRA